MWVVSVYILHKKKRKTSKQKKYYILRESISKSLCVEMSCTVTVPCLGVAIISNLYVHLVQAGRQHREKAGDVCRRPVHGDALLSAYEHGAVVVLASKVWTLDAKNAVSYRRRPKRQYIFSTKEIFSHSSGKIFFFFKSSTDRPAD